MREKRKLSKTNRFYFVNLVQYLVLFVLKIAIQNEYQSILG